jgi:hypothetical protein
MNRESMEFDVVIVERPVGTGRGTLPAPIGTVYRDLREKGET